MLGAPAVRLPRSTDDGPMTTELTHRAEPCTTCGQPVTRVKIFREGLGPHYGQLGADYLRHADRAVSGDMVDEECNYPTGRLPQA
jgi:hypothetical protein